MAIIASTLALIASDPLACLGGRERINDFFARADHVWRECTFDPANTLGLFLLQVLHGNTAISHLRHLKTTLGMEQLKCQTADGVAKELMVFVLANGIQS